MSAQCHVILKLRHSGVINNLANTKSLMLPDSISIRWSRGENSKHFELSWRWESRRRKTMMSLLNVSVNRRVPQFPHKFQYTSGCIKWMRTSSLSTGRRWCNVFTCAVLGARGQLLKACCVLGLHRFVISYRSTNTHGAKACWWVLPALSILVKLLSTHKGENLILEPGGKVSGKAWGRVWVSTYI